MNEAFEKWWKTNGIEQATYTEKSAAKKGFRAGMLAAAEICEQVGPKEGSISLVSKGFAEAIREAAKS